MPIIRRIWKRGNNKGTHTETIRDMEMIIVCVWQYITLQIKSMNCMITFVKNMFHACSNRLHVLVGWGRKSGDLV